MPLPIVSEVAADRIAVLLAEFDQALLDHVVDGVNLPDVDDLVAAIELEVAMALRAGLREVDPTATVPAGMVEEVAGPIRDQMEVATRRAVRARGQVPDALPEQAEDETDDAFDLRVGALIAFVVVARELDKTKRRAKARQVGVSLPRRTAGYAKMLVRTETAVKRNRWAADVVDRRNRGDVFRAAQQPNTGDWVVFVEDARSGPTDEPCEKVNRRFATALWARKHPVEHPNCTRRTRPVRLPAGRRVTLFA